MFYFAESVKSKIMMMRIETIILVIDTFILPTATPRKHSLGGQIYSALNNREHFSFLDESYKLP